MTHCVVAQSPCWYSLSDNPKRKYPQTLEWVTTRSGDWAGIHSARANALVAQALMANAIAPLSGYREHYQEVIYGSEKSRLDFLLKAHALDTRECLVEVKIVTLMLDAGQGLFPDAVSARGTKHLRELMRAAAEGKRAVLLFCVQHTGILRVAPADDIDPIYGATLRLAAKAGVELLAYGVQINLAAGQVTLAQPLEIDL
jgi:sugar fermentation stimulation protein A